jgi:hypothetical protein
MPNTIERKNRLEKSRQGSDQFLSIMAVCWRKIALQRYKIGWIMPCKALMSCIPIDRKIAMVLQLTFLSVIVIRLIGWLLRRPSN